MGKKRPWNLINFPVYSLATYRDGKVNMNICTYVTPISLKPKLYAVAVFENTQSLENVELANTAVLQILRKPHLDLVNILGKKSGKNMDKYEFLSQKKLLTKWKSFDVLKDAAAYLLLEKQSKRITGDHTLYTFAVKHYSTQNDKDILMFQNLVDEKIIL